MTALKSPTKIRKIRVFTKQYYTNISAIIYKLESAKAQNGFMYDKTDLN